MINEDEDEDDSHLANSKDGLGDPLDDSKACHDKASCIELTLKLFSPKSLQNGVHIVSHRSP